ncbi:MAG: porin family protein [Bacteroidota bacterium]|nr:porin family protein [Bacteroidota bacterium]
MRKFFIVLALCFQALFSFSQTNAPFVKEGRISGGIGIANPDKNATSIGNSLWIQLSYKFIEKVSIATEFESMRYKQPGYLQNTRIDPNEIKIYDNNFSLLFKYHVVSGKRINLMAASGWTFTTRQNDYYISEYSSTGTSFYRNVSSSSDYRIPFLGELEYSIFKNINIQARLKYNFNSQNGSTYSTGVGASLQL